MRNAALCVSLLCAVGLAQAEPGVTESRIVIGQPTGPVAAVVRGIAACSHYLGLDHQRSCADRFHGHEPYRLAPHRPDGDRRQRQIPAMMRETARNG